MTANRHPEWKGELTDLPHRAQDDLERALLKMLGNLTQNTGMVASILVGGPEPRQGGKILTMQ